MGGADVETRRAARAFHVPIVSLKSARAAPRSYSARFLDAREHLPSVSDLNERAFSDSRSVVGRRGRARGGGDGRAKFAL